MSTFIHIPEGLQSFHVCSRQTLKDNPVTILLKRVVSDLQKWLNCSWAAGMVPAGTELVPELNVVCVAGDAWRREVPDVICPIRGGTSTGLAAMVAVGPRKDGTPYSDDDRAFADALCGHIGGLLANDRLARNISDELNTAEEAWEESEIARGIYDRLDHCHAQPLRGLEYGGQCHRASRSGGDFFDLLPRDEQSLVVAIGNVAARGLPAGIMLGGVLASLKALVNRRESLIDIASELNHTLWELSPEDSFTSFLCGEIDASRKCFRYVNAGHEPALVLHRHDDRVDRLDPTGAVLGLSRRSLYRERVVAFEPGDLMAAFTDGIAESTGSGEVLRILREGMNCGVQDLAANVVGAGEAVADRTVVLVRSNEAAACPAPMEKFALVAA